MRFTQSTVVGAVLCSSLSFAVPIRRALLDDLSKRDDSSISLLNNVILLDAPGFRNGSNVFANFKAYTFIRGTDHTPFPGLIADAVKVFGLNTTDNSSAVIADRAKLFFSIPSENKQFNVALVDGCQSACLGPTADGGFLEQLHDLGACSSENGTLTAQVQLGHLDNRVISAKVFASSPDGFGIISDIDDTIKNSFVLDKAKAAQAAFIDEPTPVDGMPELFASLNTSLSNPVTNYVSGSPVQFFPFLQSFIADNYIPGAINLENFTFTDIPAIVDSLRNSSSIFDFKTAQIEQLIQFYPQKKFVQIGDSTQKDPEVYGNIFRNFPDSVQCSWIRMVDGANNTAERFAAAFEGVPSSKFKIFMDPSELMELDVANGQCS